MAAATWDYFETDDSDYGFYLDLIARGEGRVLDVGCATGRLLIPYLKAGIDIEGVDSSEEMLSICRDKAARRGLAPVLYRQRMEALDLPHRYTTIIVPGGSFQLVTDREEAHLTLRRFHAHLEPGGNLAISLDDPDEEMYEDSLGRWRTSTTLLRYTADLRGRRVAEEVHTMRMRVYSPDEIRLMLETAGLTDVRMHRGPRAVTATR
jgi:ubiquinone/menaquinone biosynthesis C-methylase UbiE